jgi:hypothetical protein
MPNKAEEIIMTRDEVGAYTGLGLPLSLRAHEEGLGVLSRPECYFVAVYQLDMDVNNGGFYGYFTNTSGDLAAEALAGLEHLGSRHIHSLLAQACSIFPSGQVPRTQRERELFLQGTSGDRWADIDTPNQFRQFLQPLDREFYASTENLIRLSLDFVRRHIDEFHIT